MKIEKIEVGSLATNCYLIFSNDEICLIDPGADSNLILEELSKYSSSSAGKQASINRKVKFIVATHYHWDHVKAIPELVENLNTELYLGKKDYPLYQDENESYPHPDQLLEEDDVLGLGDTRFEVWETPGHSPGSITLANLEEEKLFVGDLIFAGGFGRTDLPGGSRDELKKSLARVVNSEKNWDLYPGHGQTTDVKTELNRSYLLQQVLE